MPAGRGEAVRIVIPAGTGEPDAENAIDGRRRPETRVRGSRVVGVKGVPLAWRTRSAGRAGGASARTD